MACAVSGCHYVAPRKSRDLLPPLELDLCEYHWVMLQQKSGPKEVSAFAERLKAIDDGRFVAIIEALNVMDECFNCFYLHPAITDPGMGYRCKCSGSCIAATLSNGVISYLFWKLGVITEEQHMQNVNSDRLHKIPGEVHDNGTLARPAGQPAL